MKYEKKIVVSSSHFLPRVSKMRGISTFYQEAYGGGLKNPFLNKVQHPARSANDDITGLLDKLGSFSRVRSSHKQGVFQTGRRHVLLR